jgi:hypothetical protein
MYYVIQGTKIFLSIQSLARKVSPPEKVDRSVDRSIDRPIDRPIGRIRC